jgi:uncharacterized protein Veg
MLRPKPLATDGGRSKTRQRGDAVARAYASATVLEAMDNKVFPDEVE